MTEEKFTAVNSPAPPVSPATPRHADGGGWLARIFKPGREQSPSTALTVQHTALGPRVETPRTDAARALALASGLVGRSAPTPVAVAVAAGLMLALMWSLYFFYRHQPPAAVSTPQTLNLEGLEDKITQLVQAGEQVSLQDPVAAAEYYKKALDLRPERVSLLVRLADLYYLSNNYDEAVWTYSRVLELDGKNLDARLGRMFINDLRGLRQEARQDAEVLASLTPPDSPKHDLAKQMLAALRPELDNVAARHAMRREKRLPNLPTANSDWRVSIQPAQPLLAPSAPLAPSSSANPGEPPSVQALVEQRTQEGHLLVKYKNYDTAIESYKQAVKLTPDDKNLYYHLASAYRGAGRNAEAHEYYKKCLDSATYGGTCRDGMKKTEKAAREAAKRGQSVQKPGAEE